MFTRNCVVDSLDQAWRRVEAVFVGLQRSQNFHLGYNRVVLGLRECLACHKLLQLDWSINVVSPASNRSRPEIGCSADPNSHLADPRSGEVDRTTRGSILRVPYHVPASVGRQDSEVLILWPRSLTVSKNTGLIGRLVTNQNSNCLPRHGRRAFAGGSGTVPRSASMSSSCRLRSSSPRRGARSV